ncbi:uncharacterized protein J3R85_018695 [Psidium guajava]|nr:uncharacterized protein J3R85_018695 [Psidium guajava]
MESRDLSTAPSPAASAAAAVAAAPAAATAPPAEDDGVMSDRAALAKEAFCRFQSRKNAECLEFLHQLLQKKDDDPKVLHNIAVAEYFRDGCSDPRRLLEVLDNVKRKSEELARASLEQVEVVGNVGNKAMLGPKGSSTVAQQMNSLNTASILYTDEFDSSVATFNIAVIWFHLHEYGKALSILEPLYNNIQPIDETVALHICLLLLDVALACHDAAKSADVLNYLERAFGVSQGENGSSVQQQSANLVGKSSSVPNSSLISDASNQESSVSINASEKPLSRTLSEETLDYETMLSTLDIGGQDAIRAMGIPSSVGLSRSPIDKTITAVDFKLKLQLYKVRFLLLTGNLKAAKREVKGAMNVARGRDSSMALILKSQLEYARGNYRKAIKLLMALGVWTEAGISSMFLNNLGCVYHQLVKYHSASVFFSKALSGSSSIRKEKPLKLSSISQDKSLFIAYNCGIHYLACGKPILAARCLQKALLVFYNRPLFWFRLAECCLMALEKGIFKTGDASDETIKLYVVGKGKWRHIAVKDVPDNGLTHLIENDCSLGCDGQLNLSLKLARLCLLNALYIINESESSQAHSSLPLDGSLDGTELTEETISGNSNHRTLPGIDGKPSNAGLGLLNANGDVKDQKTGISQEITSGSLSMYEDNCRRQLRQMKQAILANQAYVELELENPMEALSCALSILQLPDCSRIYIFLAHVYAAEALCLLNQTKDAAEHLSVYMSEGNQIELPYGEEDFEQWRTERIFDPEETNGGILTANNFSSEETQVLMFLKPEEARATLYANLAAKSALQGELETAQQLVAQALALLPDSREATLTAVYVHLMLGNSQEALSKLKQFNHVRFLPFTCTLDKSS